jgi:type I restriction enzyme, R subunit
MATIVARADSAAAEIDLDEASTRTLIDAAPRARGWEVDTQTVRYASGTRPQRQKHGDCRMAEQERPGRLCAFHRDESLGVIGAKRRNKNVSSHIDQAQRYARGFRQFAGLNDSRVIEAQAEGAPL